MASLQLKITGMHCAHCVATVEQALQKVSGVYGASVDLEHGSAEVDYDDRRAKPDALLAAVTDAGYGAEVVE
jgi:copper ion binding protein